MANPDGFRIAQSCASDARAAVREFHARVIQSQTALVIFFCSSKYDLDAIADEMRCAFGDVPVIGCTTAGEIGPAGYRDRSISGMSFPASLSTAVSGRLDNLRQFEVGTAGALAHGLMRQLETRAPDAKGGDTFAFLLIDGLSIREEPVAATLQGALGAIPLVGGSAGDDLKFARTLVFHDGAFHDDSAVLALVSTSLPFKVFKTQHFLREDERLVVTEAMPTQRIVKEINGLPAAEEYARLVGVGLDDLDPKHFAAFPVVVSIDGTDYVRSIQKANPDGSLTFYCAIDEGLVFRIARGTDLVENLARAMTQLRAEIGLPQALLACDCILRNLEMSAQGVKDRVSDLFRENNAVGFSTYGEQYWGVHVNQTLTGIAIGGTPDGRHP